MMHDKTEMVSNAIWGSRLSPHLREIILLFVHKKIVVQSSIHRASHLATCEHQYIFLFLEDRGKLSTINYKYPAWYRQCRLTLGNLNSLPATRAVSSSRSARLSSRAMMPGISCTANESSAWLQLDQSQLTCSRAIQSSAICERMSSSSARWL